jgi:DNA-binding transcriptional regulator YiaG
MSTFYRELRHAVDKLVEAEDNVTKAREAEQIAENIVGKALRNCREYRKLSLRECARQIGVSAPYLSDVERGRRSISTGNLELLLGILIPSRSFIVEQILDAQANAHKMPLKLD